MNSIASSATWCSRLGLGGLVTEAEADAEASCGDNSRGMSGCECEIAISDGSEGDAGGDGVLGIVCFGFGVTSF